MAVDITNYSVTRNGSVTATVPRFDIAGKVVDSQTGQVLFDFTGANTVTFPNILASMTAQQLRDWLEMTVRYLVEIKTGR